MNAYKVKVQLNEDGQLALSGLPLSAGAVVEVIVLEQSRVGVFPNLLPTVAKHKFLIRLLGPQPPIAMTIPLSLRS